MVRNQHGGNKTKSFARKSFNNNNNNIILPNHPLEIFAISHKILGNATALVHTSQNTLIAHFRKKFTGRFKKDNLIQVGTILLVGLREWESTPKNCDVIEVYNQSDLAILRTVPQFPFTNEMIASYTNKRGNIVEDDHIQFDENAEEEDEYVGMTNEIISETNASNEVNIDDI